MIVSYQTLKGMEGTQSGLVKEENFFGESCGLLCGNPSWWRHELFFPWLTLMIRVSMSHLRSFTFPAESVEAQTLNCGLLAALMDK